jgi:hypothetical protein
MDDWVWGYLLGRKKARQAHARGLAVERYRMEQEIRAQYGLPPAPLVPQPTRPAPARAARRAVGVGRITGRMVRRLILAVVLLVVLLVALFAVYAIGYGVQHHLIYPAGGR